jgi:hypothetical protein
VKRQRSALSIIVNVILAICVLFLIFTTLSSVIDGNGYGTVIGIILLIVSITLWLVLARSLSKHLQKGQPGTLDTISDQGNTQRISPSVPTGNSTEKKRFVEIVQGGKPENIVPTITVSIHYETEGSLFFKEAQRFHDHEGNSAEPVPFMQYWPTYSALNPAQKRWYFYWRSEVRRGNYLPTDLSYIFLHVYETLNLVEDHDPDLAAQRIWSLWQKYRPQHPNLDNYLPDWGGDLLALKRDVATGLAWWERALPLIEYPPTQISNLMIHQTIEAGNSSKIPYRLWIKLMDYRPRNKFYQEYNTKEQLDLAYVKAIQIADEYCKYNKGHSLLLEFTSPVIHPLRKPLFVSALIGYSHPESIEWGNSRVYFGDARLSEHLNSVVKYTENLLRKKVGFSRKLSGVVLDAGLAKALDDVFIPSKPTSEPFIINIDQTRVAALRKESEQVGAILETVVEEQIPVPAKPLYTDLAEMRRLWAKLDINDRSILKRIFHNDVTSVEMLTRHLASNASSPHTWIENINKYAIELLGDKLIYQDAAGEFSLAEDYLDEMGVVVVEKLPESHQEESAAEIVDSQWAQFFAKLSPVEINLIHIFAEKGCLIEAIIEEVTRPYQVMANAALDNLNEKGADELGHPPLYFDGEQWLVETDDLPILRRQLSITEDKNNAHI